MHLHRHGPHPVLVLISNCLSHCLRLPDKPQNPRCLPCAESEALPRRGLRQSEHPPGPFQRRSRLHLSSESTDFFPFLLTSGEKSQSCALAWINVHRGGGPFDSGEVNRGHVHYSRGTSREHSLPNTHPAAYGDLARSRTSCCRWWALLWRLLPGTQQRVLLCVRPFLPFLNGAGL